jgi:hypothetical protein
LRADIDARQQTQQLDRILGRRLGGDKIGRDRAALLRRILLGHQAAAGIGAFDAGHGDGFDVAPRRGIRRTGPGRDEGAGEDGKKKSALKHVVSP